MVDLKLKASRPTSDNNRKLKEVIHPQIPLRIPCYDFTPIADPALTPKKEALGITDFRGVTGGVYKTRERIHRRMADRRLLAIPAS